MAIERVNDCEHPDVQYSKDHRGAVACYACGRLFGHLEPSGRFVAFNPDYLTRTGVSS